MAKVSRGWQAPDPDYFQEDDQPRNIILPDEEMWSWLEDGENGWEDEWEDLLQEEDNFTGYIGERNKPSSGLLLGMRTVDKVIEPKDATVLGDVKDKKGNILQVLDDLRVYRKVEGGLPIGVPTKPIGEEKVVLNPEEVDWSQVPGLGEIARVFYWFLSRYTDREVACVFARDWKNPKKWWWMIPEQVGTPGGVEWDDKQAMKELSDKGLPLGSVHVHPGDGCEPSGTDTTTWRNGTWSGFHFILGRGGKYTLHGVADKRVVRLESGDISPMKKWAKKKPLKMMTSGGRKLVELLKKPKPVQEWTGPVEGETLWDKVGDTRRFQRWLQGTRKEKRSTGKDGPFHVHRALMENPSVSPIWLPTKKDRAFVLTFDNGTQLLLKDRDFKLLERKGCLVGVSFRIRSVTTRGVV